MPKPGRPPKQGRTREGSRTLPVRFTLEELGTIRDSATVEGKSVSDFSRGRLLDPPPDRLEIETLRHVARWGRQLVHALDNSGIDIRTGGALPGLRSWLSALDDLEADAETPKVSE
jgi:hypothetical protein